MHSSKNKKTSKLLKIDMSSGSDNDDSEHELSYYAKDKVKLMKEVLKLIKPKKIKSMAPDCIKNLDIVEINSMLLEELLGISNKRLQYIFNGENVDRETSSSESDEEKQPVDVISLDDISDDDDIELCISQDEQESLEYGLSKKNKSHKSHKIKVEPQSISVKNEVLEKFNKDKKKPKKLGESSKKNEENEKEKLMSVLELLELQARARAIRSQLAIETEKKSTTEATENLKVKQESESDSDAIIIDSPQDREIVITSESEDENSNSSQFSKLKQNQHGSESEHLKERRLEDSELSLHKKQKLGAEDNLDIADTSVQSENPINITNVVLDSIDLTETSKEHIDLDLKSRKEKLLTKIQKIKLIRNKNLGCKITKNFNNSNASQNKKNKTTSEETISETPNSMVLENLLKDTTESREAKLVDTETTSVASAAKVEIPQAALTDLSIKQDKICCDNDEIVINLDEDEMDDMEND